MAKTKEESKYKKGQYLCPHCSRILDFPGDYCKICNDHHHDIFMGKHDKIAHPNICTHCWKGRSEVGRAWRRAQGTWSPDLEMNSHAWDNPEWYDGSEEWKNNTIQFVWIEDEYNIEEL